MSRPTVNLCSDCFFRHAYGVAPPNARPWEVPIHACGRHPEEKYLQAARAKCNGDEWGPRPQPHTERG